MSSDRDLLAARGGFNGCVLGREGYVVYNRNDLYVGRAVERYGEYGEIEARLLRQACPAGAVAVEVGANLGTHTLVLARSAGPAGFVYAYEPQRVVFQCLCANLAVNSTMNVDARHAAVGSEAGFVLMPDIDYGREANFGSVSANAFSEGRKVRRVRLDDDLELGRLDLLKIDVEGMESEVIAGGTQLIERLRPVLYVENDRVEHSEALIRQIMQLDYRLYWHLPPLFNEDNYFGERENIYSNIVSVNMLCVPRSRPQVLNGFQEILDPGEHPMRGTPGS
jgi:FkbM family methyltransferase